MVLGLGYTRLCFAAYVARGVVSGPRKEFSETEEKFNLHVGKLVYFQSQVRDYWELRKFENEVTSLRQTLKCMILTCRNVVPELVEMVQYDFVFDSVVGIDGWRSGFDKGSTCSVTRKAPKCIKQFDEMGNAGTDATLVR